VINLIAIALIDTACGSRRCKSQDQRP